MGAVYHELFHFQRAGCPQDGESWGMRPPARRVSGAAAADCRLCRSLATSSARCSGVICRRRLGRMTLATFTKSATSKMTVSSPKSPSWATSTHPSRRSLPAIFGYPSTDAASIRPPQGYTCPYLHNRIISSGQATRRPSACQLSSWRTRYRFPNRSRRFTHCISNSRHSKVRIFVAESRSSGSLTAGVRWPLFPLAGVILGSQLASRAVSQDCPVRVEQDHHLFPCQRR
jgi:hypothetical protein